MRPGNAFSLIAGEPDRRVAAYYACYVLGVSGRAAAGAGVGFQRWWWSRQVLLCWRQGNIPLSATVPRWDNGLTGQLSKFTLMALITSVTCR